MYRRVLKDPKTKGSRSPAKRAPPMKVVEEYLASVKKSPNPPAPNLMQFRRDRPRPAQCGRHCVIGREISDRLLQARPLLETEESGVVIVEASDLKSSNPQNS